MIKCDQGQLIIHSDRDSIEAFWPSIISIHAVKQDTFNPNIINIIISTKDGDYEFSETDVDNHPSFTAAISQYLCDVAPFNDWHKKVTAPETRLDEIQIYSRQ
jgi:hypothetical protein